MRFAFKTAPQNTTWADMLAVWRAGDDIELFESAWNFDHFYPIFSRLDGAMPGGMGHADGTGSGHSPVAPRHPRNRHPLPAPGRAGEHGRHAWTSSRAAGSSSGSAPVGTKKSPGAYGIELGSPRERSDRFEEACEVLVGLLSQETTTFTGQYFRLTNARCNPKPVQRPHPPICIGGSGERRTLRTVARFAQHWNFVGGTVDEFRAKRDVLYGHCADIGRDPADILISSHVRFERRPESDCGCSSRTGRGGGRPGHRAAATAPPCRRPRAFGRGAGRNRLTYKALHRGDRCCPPADDLPLDAIGYSEI